MPRGGKRPGAGRPRGSLTKKSQEILVAAAAAGEQPLEYLLRVMRDPTVDARTRLDVAIAACPYLHPRLAATQIKAEVEQTSVILFKTSYEDADAGIPPTRYFPEALANSPRLIEGEGYDEAARAADEAELARLRALQRPT